MKKETTVALQAAKASKRKRLAKAFPRPLEKARKKREGQRHPRFALLPEDIERLARLKRELAAQGIAVKKSELIRAGLAVLASQPVEECKAAVAALPAAG